MNMDMMKLLLRNKQQKILKVTDIKEHLTCINCVKVCDMTKYRNGQLDLIRDLLKTLKESNPLIRTPNKWSHPQSGSTTIAQAKRLLKCCNKTRKLRKGVKKK